MQCPGCATDFRLTWMRYLKAPFGKMPCPACGVRIRWTHRWFYWFLMPLPSVAIAPWAILVGIKSGLVLAIALSVVWGLLVTFSFDRFLESRFAVPVLDERSEPARTGE
jgi:hypothetical protein